jgi:hypothetical protein
MSVDVSLNQYCPLVCPVPIRVRFHGDVAQIMSKERMGQTQAQEAFDSYLAMVKQCGQPCGSSFTKACSDSSFPEYSLWSSRKIVQWD